jgi:hypothetical protein
MNQSEQKKQEKVCSENRLHDGEPCELYMWRVQIEGSKHRIQVTGYLCPHCAEQLGAWKVGAK